MSVQEQHIRTFARLANFSQTRQLHEWNLESLHRALQWAEAAERAASTEPELVCQWFPVATLPTLPLDEALTAQSLQHARVHLLQSVLQSPFLETHPTRTQLVAEILRELQACAAETGEEVEMNAAISGLLAEKAVARSRTDAMLAIARRLRDGCKPVRVKVLSGWVEILPLTSYTLSPRTLQLKAMAKTLQRNAVDARAAADPEPYRSFLEKLRSCFELDDSGDVREIVALMLVLCEWPAEEPEPLRGMFKDLESVVREWIEGSAIRLWGFKPWLAALLACKLTTVRRTYVAELFRTGLLPPWEREFSERVATLIMADEEIQTQLDPALASLEPYLRRQYFNAS